MLTDAQQHREDCRGEKQGRGKSEKLRPACGAEWLGRSTAGQGSPALPPAVCRSGRCQWGGQFRAACTQEAGSPLMGLLLLLLLLHHWRLGPLHIFRLGTRAGTSTFRPRLRRAASTLRPPGVAMRARKPLTRARFLQARWWVGGCKAEWVGGRVDRTGRDDGTCQGQQHAAGDALAHPTPDKAAAGGS